MLKQPKRTDSSECTSGKGSKALESEEIRDAALRRAGGSLPPQLRVPSLEE